MSRDKVNTTVRVVLGRTMHILEGGWTYHLLYKQEDKRPRCLIDAYCPFTIYAFSIIGSQKESNFFIIAETNFHTVITA